MNSIAQFLMPAFRFGLNDPQEAIKLVDAGVSGFCLYGGKALEVASFTKRLTRHGGRLLLFASDFENGAGSQISDMTELVSNMGLGQNNHILNARLKGFITAEQAKFLGINWIFAPVVDLDVRTDNPIVNIRSFGKSPKLVAAMANALIAPIEKNHLASCIKHFPGHGDTIVDSHLDLARIKRPISTLFRQDLFPYRALLQRTSSIMSCHLVHPQIDALPASLSKKWISGILRQKLGFKKIIVTDALMMGAITRNFSEEDYLRLGLEAGNDILLYPPDPWSAIKTLQKLGYQLNQTLLKQSQQRLSVFLKRLHPAVKRPEPSPQSLARLNLAHQQAAEKISQDCLRWYQKPTKNFSLNLNSKSLRYLEVGNKKITLNLDLILKTSHAHKSSQKDILAMHDKTHFTSLSRLLISLGFSLSHPNRGPKNSALLIGIFHKPRAFSGSIGLETDDLKKIKTALKINPHAPVLAVAFGDPRTLSVLPKKWPLLAAFSDSPASQRAVAKLIESCQ